MQFIQVIQAEKHSLKTKYMTEFLNVIKLNVEKVEAVFLVPVDIHFSLLSYIDNLLNEKKELFCSIRKIK